VSGGGDSDGDALAALLTRRSVGRVRPDPLPRALVEQLIAAAVRAPNHHLTEPWRFVVLAGDARRAVGAAHARAVARARPGYPEAGLAKEAARLERAPVVVACVVRPSGSDPVTAREDRDAVAAAAENLLLAAHARGLGAMWRTGTMADEPEVHRALGLEPGDAIVAFVYLGWPDDGSPPPTARRSVEEVSSWLGWDR
jgi:nitroreductase